MRTFADLRDPDEHHAGWLRQMREAELFAKSLQKDAIVETMRRHLEAVYASAKAFDDGELWERIQREHLADLALPRSRESAGPTLDNVTQIILNDALAGFLTAAKPTPERLTAVANVDRFLDIKAVAKGVAAAGIDDWLPFLQSLRVDVTSLNDDEYRASDGVTAWATERKRPVPSWRRAEHVRDGMEMTLLASEILRALDVDMWLTFVDRLTHPVSIVSVLWEGQLDGSPSDLLDWIRRAPAAFDADGHRSESVVVYAVIDRARDLFEQSLQRRTSWGRESEHQTVLSEDAPLREELTQAILSRPDGKVLLAELGAEYLDRAQTGSADSPWTQLRHGLCHALGVSFVAHLGTPSGVLALARDRESRGGGRSLWGLWLLAASSSGNQQGAVQDDAALRALRDCWSWLRELLASGDSGIAKRYSPFAQWTEQLAAKALLATESPHQELGSTWATLAPQRLTRRDIQSNDDTWLPSRLLIRTGFFAAHLAKAADGGDSVELWQTSMKMAITEWFHRPLLNPFAQVVYGLAHLAAGKIAVPSEPSNTFAYLVGEVDEVADAATIMLANGADPAALMSDANAAGIDLREYLALARNDRNKEAIDQALAKLP